MSRSIYTDLALEMAESLQGKDCSTGIDGVLVEVNNDHLDIKVTTVKITNEKGAKAMGKPIGSYITIESPEIKSNNITVHEDIIQILTNTLAKLTAGANDNVLNRANDNVLVVGLGNQSVTPDALGPKVVGKVLVTRHIMEGLPKELEGKLRPIAAIAPGVMGTTGIETAEAVRGLIGHVKPSMVIAIDALAARNISRINQTIQIADTGINPGSGVGNKRMGLNQESLGVPVIAIGVPTVVDAATFVNDTMDMFLAEMAQDMPQELEDKAAFYKMLNALDERDKHTIIRNTIDPLVGNMFVTPKEIGQVVAWLSNIIANAINLAMHKGIDKDDINRFMY